MKNSYPALMILPLLMVFISCSGQNNDDINRSTPEISEKSSSNQVEPHRYGGWYCPDNFGFKPVDIQQLDKVPAIDDRLPTKEELQEKKSLIEVDTEKYPDARALHMDLPRLARRYHRHNDMNELVIIIQAIIVNEDTIVGYRFPNGGNGSARISEVSFLNADEVKELGSLPYYYSTIEVKATTEDVWTALTQTPYFNQLGEKFNKKKFFKSQWSTYSEAHLNIDKSDEKAKGYIGTLFGNVYMQIDYDRNGFHFSEKLLISENTQSKTAEIHFASGPYPQNFKKAQVEKDAWLQEVQNILKKD